MQKPVIKRKIRNFLLMPILQIKLSVYVIILSFILITLIAWIIYSKMGEVAGLIIQLTDVEEEIRTIISEYVIDMSWWISISIIGYIFIIVAMTIIYTHKLVGPTYAFKRHIRSLIEGNFNARTFLRKGDAFTEIADELNNLSDHLKNTLGNGKIT